MKIRIIIVLATVAVVVAMIVEWRFASWMGASSAIHNYHGICNGGVGEPYQDFVHKLRLMAESGDTNRLVVVLRRADERSRDIYEVWLRDGYGDDFYQKSIDEILR
jgi:hypothetical protein